MKSSRCRALVAALLTLLSTASAAGFTFLRGNSTCLPNYQLTWVAGSSTQTVLPAGTKYPACAYDVHQRTPSASTWTYLYGGYDPVAATVGSTLYASNNSWATLAQPPAVSSVVATNNYGMGAVLANGNFVLVGGRTDNTATTAASTVYFSTDHGRTFALATASAPFGGLYNGQLVVMPGTNSMVLIGGIDSDGDELNECWLSTDGVGAVWTLQSNASNLPNSGLAGAVALYDNSAFNPALYHSPNSTILFFLEYSSGQYYQTFDAGRTWTSYWLYPMSVSTATSSLTASTSSLGHRDYMSFTADTDNNIYALGAYNGPDAFVWLSTTRGQSWQILHQRMAIPGLATSLQFQWAAYNCLALSYSNDSSTRQLTIFGYQTYTSDATTWQVLTAQVNTPIGVSGQGALPNATIASALPSSALLAVSSPSCAYNLHALTSSPLMFTAGGQIGYVEQNVAYTSTNNGASFSQVATTVWPTQPLYSAGSAMLSNGNLLLIGGQTNNNASTHQSTVYFSSNGGSTWTLSTATAAFGARSNFAACVMPNTNTVYVVGGSLNNNSAALTDSSIFASYDGTGAMWTRVGRLPVATLAGTCVFLYDNAATSSSYTAANSTLLVFTHTMRLYRSYTGGSSWDATPSQTSGTSAGALTAYITVPFATQYDNSATRYQLEVVADYDHNLYATGGAGVYDNGLYFSGDLGLTWYRLRQANTVNAGVFIQASTSCLALSYVAFGSTYTKQLTLYGGQGVQFDLGNNTYSTYAAVNIQLDSPTAFVPPASQGTAQSTTAIIQQADAAKLWCDDGSVGIQWQAASTAATSQYEKPACASGYLTADSTQSTPFILYGGQSGTTIQSKSVFSTDGFQTIVNTATNTSAGQRTGGHAAILASGIIIVAGGMTTSTSVSASAIANDVWASSDNGQTFTFVNSSFPAKAEGQLLSIPGSPGWLVLIGGYTVQGDETADIWLSSNGGATWTLQTSSSPVPTNALASSFALYDSSWVSSALYSSPNATIGFLLEYSNGAYWMSYDLGRTWSVNYIYPMSTALASASSITHRDWMEVAVDRDNVIYAGGMYNNPESQMWYSPTKGQTWYTLQNVPSVWASKSAYTQQSQIQYGCMGVQYGTSVVTGQRVKQLVAYGYFTFLSDGKAYSSIVGNLINAPVGVQLASIPPAATLSSAVPAAAISNGASPTCAYNVHFRNGAMLAIGGSSSTAASGAAFTASTGSFSSAAAGSLYSYNVSSLPPTSGGGAALLNNGLLLSFGGISAVDGVTLSNAVYSSSSTAGIAFTAVANASWSPRADFLTCTMPYSNTVVLIGGVTAVGYVNDVWISTDGAGAVWTQQPPANYPFVEATGTGANAGIQAGTCVFLYDSALVPGSGSTQPMSTLLVFTHNNRVYKSRTGGATWVQQPNAYYPTAPKYMVAPFSTQSDSSKTRRGLEVVADFDNRLYAMGGNAIYDNTMWWSADGALTWYRMAQVNTVSAGYFIQASTSCLALNYRTNTSAAGGYSKTLVLYGGSVQFDDGTQVGALQVAVADAVVFLPSSANAAPFNATLVAVAAPPTSGVSSSSTGTAVGPTTTPSSAAPPTPSPSSSSASNSGSGGASSSDNSGGSSGLSSGAIAGIVVGSVVGGMVICASLVLCFVLRVRNNKKQPTETPRYAPDELDSAHSTEHGVEMHTTQ